MDRRVYDNYVMKVAELGSLTGAAAALGVSQPALSSGLNNLEKNVGIKIFNRRSVPVSFTPEGLIYFDYIKRIGLLTDDFNKRIISMKEDLNKKVVIGGPVAYVESIVTDAVVELKTTEPEIKVEIRSAPLEDLIEMSMEGKLNCFISTSENLPDNFEKRPVKTERVYMVVPKDNPVNETIRNSLNAPGKEFDHSVLNGQQFIFLDDNKPLQKKINRFIEERNIQALNSIVVDQVSTAVNLSIKGAGICFASEEALEGNIKLDKVCIYPLIPEISGRVIYIAYDKELFMTDACKQLIEILIKKYEK